VQTCALPISLELHEEVDAQREPALLIAVGELGGEAQREEQAHALVEGGELRGRGAIRRALLEDAALHEVPAETEEGEVLGEAAADRLQLPFDAEELADEEI